MLRRLRGVCTIWCKSHVFPYDSCFFPILFLPHQRSLLFVSDIRVWLILCLLIPNKQWNSRRKHDKIGLHLLIKNVYHFTHRNCDEVNLVTNFFVEFFEAHWFISASMLLLDFTAYTCTFNKWISECWNHRTNSNVSRQNNWQSFKNQMVWQLSYLSFKHMKLFPDCKHVKQLWAANHETESHDFN